MSYGVPAGRLQWALGEEEALPVLDEAYKAGFNFFDTADTYSGGYSEQILGKAIKKYGWRRENIVIATKCFAPVALDPDEVPHFMTEHERDNKGVCAPRL
jgi:aryl-alcohol dehydrogenase-like predicted oxidoreductase